ncbi:unnamed protein product [Didymodactylos carnosus]|uniref:Uncharacterized protein n=1 Tax=Didymodactylos carnosus TaxID=1234261 RepID=A0A8S2UIL5_9BILA|nr:unnamed protein product [Didymodactylos carnosus]
MYHLELVRLFGNGPENPELNNLTIGTFMQRFGEDADSRNSDGTSLVSELFSVMTSQMRFSDVWNLVLGNPIVGTRFSAARHSATDYLQNTLLQGRPITPETIDELCAQLYQSLIQEASIDFNELPVKPHINLKNVMKRFFMHHGRAILNIIFHDDDNVWFDHFRQQLICLRNEYLALASHCFEGGESAAIEYLLNRHRAIFRSTNQMILTWSETYLRTCLTNAFSSIRSSPPNILTYLNEPPTSNQLPQEHHNGVTLSTPVNTIPQTSTIASKTGNERQEQKLTMTTASQENTNWQADLPEDWIPIVIGDVAVQTHVQPQPPFSNAYKDGIPAKRRRVHNREDLTSTNLLNNILIRAAQSSNTQSQLPDSDSLRHMASSPEVLQTFEQELKRLLELRLKNDRDYEKIHTRMPNTKRYLEE